ncbi:hypothetical protein BatF92_42240 [Bacteroides thetaiotaomicron]|uniref:Uncharacterized protein n=1 Tax=Bacteroides thetaiotaomicron TaxID=818 RepID=A0A679HTT9_BACT4|nr:hypothetical protein BatF92_42240 [Bacteroides thetaiotaomicron]
MNILYPGTDSKYAVTKMIIIKLILKILFEIKVTTYPDKIPNHQIIKFGNEIIVEEKFRTRKTNSIIDTPRNMIIIIFLGFKSVLYL